MQPQNQSKLDPNQISVGLAQTNNFLQQHLKSQMPPEAPQTSPQPQSATPSQEATKPAPDENEAKMTKLELDMTKKIDDLRGELDEKHKLEIDKLRNDIKEALDAEETNEPK